MVIESNILSNHLEKISAQMVFKHLIKRKKSSGKAFKACL
jgi:hypothetical protein